MPRYLIEGIATPEVYASLIKAPVDRGDNARGLISLGYKDDDIRKIMGGNMMRLVKEVIG